ncbi:hypothetical protein [Ekhidna sp.]|uniref:hypothetical protein n=1 Tax=Ekhidna sp. TaxID=2608089 RepID=UPI003C7D73C0
MKNLSFFFILLSVFVMIQGCSNTSEQVDDAAVVKPVVYNPNSSAYIAAVQQLVDAMLAGDSVALTALTTDDFVSIYVTNPMDTINKEDFIQDWVSFQTSRSDQQNERVAASALKVNEGDFVGDWVQYWGNYSAYMVDADTTIWIPYFVNLELSEGKISKMFSYYDRVPIWQAVGYQITPPGQ